MNIFDEQEEHVRGIDCPCTLCRQENEDDAWEEAALLLFLDKNESLAN